jgi:hypothetical protein
LCFIIGIGFKAYVLLAIVFCNITDHPFLSSALVRAKPVFANYQKAFFTSLYSANVGDNLNDHETNYKTPPANATFCL